MWLQLLVKLHRKIGSLEKVQ